MAYVVKRGSSWYARWLDGAGRRRSEKTACSTRKDAQRLAEDIERKAERQRRGLEALPEDAPTMTFGELYKWWWEQYGCKLRGDFGGFLQKRLVAKLERLPLQEVSAPRIEGLLQSQSNELSPKSLNELRGCIHTLFRRA